jgi:hypothetical protein
MRPSERAWRIGRDFAGVLPRAQAALTQEAGWKPLSPSGIRLLGEVLLDELALTGMTLTAPPPKLERPVGSCAAAAEELCELGVARAHAEPEPLRVRAIRRRRIGRLAYEQMTFDHDPLLPRSLAAEGLGGPATAAVHLCRSGDDRRPWLVWVHEAGQGQPLDLLFSRARRIQDDLGFNIALPLQPGEPSPPPHRRLIVGAWHDRMALREPALALHARWGGELYWHDGGHAGHLISRRVQAESERFLLSLPRNCR